MDLYSIVEGPLLWIVFIIFLAVLFVRLSFFLYTLIVNSKNKENRALYTTNRIGRLFLPYHRAFTKKPLYATLRYLFHICLFVVPIWLSGHIVLWSESRFEWDWAALPDAMADWMTLILLALAAYFLLRRFTSAEMRKESSIGDIVLIVITALPFLTGYFLTHATLESVAFLGDNMITIHILSAELMVLTAIFLFYSPRLNVQRCTGCASCVQNCPTETLESDDRTELRFFKYSHFQCICCGSCVGVCPEDAAELRHEINAKRFFQILSKREIQAVELEACERCGAFFAPEPQMEKISKTFTSDSMKFCPKCRKFQVGDRLHQLSPWHRRKKPSATKKTA